MKPLIFASLAWLLFLAHNLAAAEFPQAEISNSYIRAKLYLPDARQGYYRGTRFDWSGVVASLEGHGSSSKDYDIRVENRKTGAGVRQTGDRPLSKVVFWSIRSNISPELYIDRRIEPGKESTWRITYEFYTLPRSGQK